MREAATPAAASPAELATPLAALARNAAFLVLGQAGTTLLSVVLSAALGRTLGAAEYGRLFLVTTMTTFAYGIVDWGQGMYVAREVARDGGRAGDLLGSSIAFRAAAAAVVAAPALAVAWGLGYDGSTLWLLAILLGAYLPTSIVQAHGIVFRGRERMELDALLQVTAKALALGTTLAALALGARALGVVVAQGLAGALAALAAVAVFRGVRMGTVRAHRRVLRDLLVGGAPMVALNVAIAAQPYLDAIVVSKLAPPEVMGWHAAVKTFTGALVTPAAILASAAYPRLSRAASDPAALRVELAAAMRPLLLVAAAVTAGTYLLADVAVGAVYGAEGFGPAVTALELFAPALLLFFVDILLGHACVAARRTNAFAVAKALSVVVSTALGVVLVPLFQARAGNGVLGIVVAFASSELVMIAAATALLPRGALRAGLFADMGRAVLAAAAAPLAAAALPGAGTAARCALGAAVFVAVAWAVRLVTSAELALVRDLVRARIPARGGGRPS